jgi:hypothetical protein
MTLAELCFIIAVVAFVVEALPMIGMVSPVKLLPAGLALAAFGLALGAGLAGDLGVEGKIL